ncbi:hypothetical protein V4T71_002941 [Vibrio vulnificus]
MYQVLKERHRHGATCNSSANREQIRDCTALLENVVPTIIEIMMDGADELWGMRFIH